MKRLHIALLLALVSITLAPFAFADDTPPGGTDSSEPMLKERIHINDLINAARQRNIGVGAYVQQMEAIEDKAFSGAPAAELKPMIDLLTAKLNGQLQESVALKNYRPAPLTEKQKHELWKSNRDKADEEKYRLENSAWKENYGRTKYASELGQNNNYHGSIDIHPHLIKSESFTDGNITQKIKADSRQVQQRSFSSTDMVLKDAGARKSWNSVQNLRASGKNVTGNILMPRDPGKP
jgi:hypothetical protein